MYLINPDSVIALTVLLTVLATLSVVVRLSQVKGLDQRYKGKTVLHSFYLEDILCVIALVSSPRRPESSVALTRTAQIFLFPSSVIIIWGMFPTSCMPDPMLTQMQELPKVQSADIPVQMMHKHGSCLSRQSG